MNPEHQRTNPQRAIDEYKNNTYGYCASCGAGLGKPSEDQVINGIPPCIKLGQGRDDVPEGDQLIEALFVLFCTFVGLAAFMFLCYLAGGWQ